MTVDTTDAAAVAALSTAIVHLLARAPGWIRSWRHEQREQIKTDAELGRELRDELYRHVQSLREENRQLREEIAKLRGTT